MHISTPVRTGITLPHPFSTPTHIANDKCRMYRLPCAAEQKYQCISRLPCAPAWLDLTLSRLPRKLHGRSVVQGIALQSCCTGTFIVCALYKQLHCTCFAESIALYERCTENCIVWVSYKRVRANMRRSAEILHSHAQIALYITLSEHVQARRYFLVLGQAKYA